MPSVTLAIPDISCGHCVAAIRTALQPVAGVTRCDVDLGRKQVRVDLADAAVLPRVQAALADEGYPATVIA